MHVVTGIRRENARMFFGRAYIDALDLRVAVRTTDERCKARADLLHVVGIGRTAGDEARIFATLHTCADHCCKCHYLWAPASAGVMMPSPLGGGSSSGGVIGI